MKNAYRVEGDIAVIALTQGQETRIDMTDVPLVGGYRWHASWNTRLGGYYVMAAVKGANGRQTTLYLHRLITGAPKGRVVDHLNDDTLDNRRENLLICGQRENIGRGKAKITTCPAGHPYDEANTHIDRDGARRCRACGRDRTRAVLSAETPEQYERRRARMQAYHERTKDQIKERAPWRHFTPAQLERRREVSRAYKQRVRARKAAEG